MLKDTIVAIATPSGRGSVGIVRLSGPQAKEIALCLNGGKPLLHRRALFCNLEDPKKALLDQGLVVYFQAPHSFTGEDVVEFQVHGSPIVLDNLLEATCFLGARLANPGEFSERAFLNDKMDLTQAEAISDLIQSSSKKAASLALRSLQGEFSKHINQLSLQLIELRMYVEASIDFVDEEIDFLSEGNIHQRIEAILETLKCIHHNAVQGSILREGLSIVIAGKPNAGKSTLINCLAGQDVAIVTDIPGTTRDVMKENILLDDIPIKLIDTAGLRESKDLIEQEGIKRALAEMKKADCILHVKDLTDDEPYLEDERGSSDFALPEGIPSIIIFNKVDVMPASHPIHSEGIYLSAKCGTGIPLLKAAIKKMVNYNENEGQFLARRRHLHALEQTQAHLTLALQEAQMTHPALEILAEELRLAHQVLGEITGEFTGDDLLGKIFSSFCIGK